MSCSSEECLTYASGLTFLADLYLHGPNGDRLAQLRQYPDLAPLLAVDEDELQADHFDLFGRSVPPVAHLFLYETDPTDGATAHRLGEIYTSVGFAPPADAPSEDHLGVILMCLAHLFSALAAAIDHGRAEDVVFWQRSTIYIMDRYLLSWVHPLQEALSHEPFPLYQKLTATLVDVLTTSRGQLLHDKTPPPPVERGKSLVRENLGDEAAVDPKRLAEALSRPTTSGLFLSRRRIKELAGTIQVPVGFDESRVAAIKSLVESAARFDKLGPLAESLCKFAGEATAFYGAEAYHTLDHSWLERASATWSVFATVVAETNCGNEGALP